MYLVRHSSPVSNAEMLLINIVFAIAFLKPPYISQAYLVDLYLDTFFPPIIRDLQLPTILRR